MKLNNLKKVWISEYIKTDDDGEQLKKWKYKGTAWLNIQQDLNELDRNTAGNIDYDILKGRTNKDYSISKGNGISFVNIKDVDSFKPEYIVTASPKIGHTVVYTLNKYNGE